MLYAVIAVLVTLFVLGIWLGEAPPPTAWVERQPHVADEATGSSRVSARGPPPVRVR
jgi:hypothetical protein